MERKSLPTKILAILGTALVWFPLLTPVLLSAILYVSRRRFLFDYLMPMELFLFALIGGGLLLWATLRAHSQVKPVAWGIGIAVFLFFGLQAYAEVTGLASGETEPIGWVWGIAIASLIVYTLALALAGTGGVLLLKDLFRRQLPTA